MKLPEFNDKANTLGPLRVLWYLFCLFVEGRTDWHIAARCTRCGHGWPFAKSPDTVKPVKGTHRWLCPCCGAPWEQSVTWVGRSVKGADVWEWKPFDALPEDIQESYKTPQPTPDANDMDARVRAQVEVELVAALAKHEATCNCRKGG